MALSSSLKLTVELDGLFISYMLGKAYIEYGDMKYKYKNADYTKTLLNSTWGADMAIRNYGLKVARKALIVAGIFVAGASGETLVVYQCKQIIATYKTLASEMTSPLAQPPVRLPVENRRSVVADAVCLPAG